MKPSEIKVGVIYHNRGKGTTFRKVIEIGSEYCPEHWNSVSEPPKDQPGVLYKDSKNQLNYALYLSSFASWAGGMVNEETNENSRAISRLNTLLEDNKISSAVTAPEPHSKDLLAFHREKMKEHSTQVHKLEAAELASQKVQGITHV